MYTAYISVPQNVELSVAPNDFSGRNKFRIALVIVGILSFFSVAIFVNHRENTDMSGFAFIDSEFYFVHNLFISTTGFSMVALADFQVLIIFNLTTFCMTSWYHFSWLQIFEYNSPFWNILKSLSAYFLLAEVESLLQFVYFIMYFDWNELEDGESDVVIFNLLVLSIIRCLVLALLYYYGSTFLNRIIKTRNLPHNYYVSSKTNVREYLLLHSFGYIIATALELGTFKVCSIVFVSAAANFYIRGSFFWSKKRHFKINAN